MNDIQTSSGFCAELDAMGIRVPPDTIEITIEMAEYDKPAMIVFSTCSIDSGVVEKTAGWEFGGGMLCSEMYAKLSENIQLPEFTSYIKITAKPNDVVKMSVEAALPSGAFNFLKN